MIVLPKIVRRQVKTGLVGSSCVFHLPGDVADDLPLRAGYVTLDVNSLVIIEEVRVEP